MKADHDPISSDNDSLLTLIDPIELMPEDGVEIICYPEFNSTGSMSDISSKSELLEFDF